MVTNNESYDGWVFLEYYGLIQIYYVPKVIVYSGNTTGPKSTLDIFFLIMPQIHFTKILVVVYTDNSARPNERIELIELNNQEALYNPVCIAQNES